MGVNKALCWTLFWFVTAAIFNAGIYYFCGAAKAAEFATAYTIEKLLSFDNLFVFLLIFNHFKVSEKDRRKVLNYGIAGAAILRALFIGFGVAVVSQSQWLLYIMGAFLLYSSWGVAFKSDDDSDIGESKIIKLAQSLSIKPLLVWIVAIELSDIIFAIDSIPAALAVSQDIFIIYSANIFAILGLRSLFFVIQYLYDYIPQLKYGIALILAFIGVKMLLPLVNIHIQSLHSLMVVVAVLVINVLVVFKKDALLYFVEKKIWK